MATYGIRTGRLEDVKAVSDLYRRSSLSNEGDRASLLAHPDSLVFDDAPVRESRTRVATEGDRVVGFATIRLVERVAELDDLFVDPDRMRRGIGRSLVLDAMEVAGSLEATRIQVTANLHARAFYESVGFVELGLRETQFGSGLRMQLKLPR